MYIELSSHVNLTGIDYFDPKLKKNPHFSGQYFKHCFRYMHMQGMKNSHFLPPINYKFCVTSNCRRNI